MVTLAEAAGLLVTAVEVCKVTSVELLAVIIAIKRQKSTIKSTMYQLYKIHTQFRSAFIKIQVEWVSRKREISVETGIA